MRVFECTVLGETIQILCDPPFETGVATQIAVAKKAISSLGLFVTSKQRQVSVSISELIVKNTLAFGKMMFHGEVTMDLPEKPMTKKEFETEKDEILSPLGNKFRKMVMEKVNNSLFERPNNLCVHSVQYHMMLLSIQREVNKIKAAIEEQNS